MYFITLPPKILLKKRQMFLLFKILINSLKLTRFIIKKGDKNISTHSK